MAKSSSRRRRRTERGLIVALLLVLFVVACLGLLIVAGYDVNSILGVYAVIATVIGAVLGGKFVSIKEVIMAQKRSNVNLTNENAMLIRQNSSLKKEYCKDYNTVMDELEYCNQQKNIAERSLKIYQKKFVELQEILENIIKSYPELKAEEEAYRAKISENQAEAKEAYKAISNCISSYREYGMRSDIEKACNIYLSLTADKRKWLPLKKKLKKGLIEAIQELKGNSDPSEASEPVDSETLEPNSNEVVGESADSSNSAN